MLATALSVSMWASASQAYTPEQEQACTGDAFRLCSSEIPDVSRVTACMVAKSPSSRQPAGLISGRMPSRAKPWPGPWVGRPSSGLQRASR
ncbi:hypothetical protein ACFIOY_01525 [Bradyrhizobium sp. TZ2]